MTAHEAEGQQRGAAGALPGSGSRSAPRRRTSLLPRVALLLTIALLPLGIIAVAQTKRAIEAAGETYRAGLGAQTARIAAPEREAILSAFGLARGLADAVSVLTPDDPACTRMMQRVQVRFPELSFLSYTGADAISRCNDDAKVYDFSAESHVQRRYADPRPYVSFNPSGSVSRAAVIIVSEPVYGPDGAFRGFVAMSFPSRSLDAARQTDDLDAEAVMVTFNADGEILTADIARQDVAAFLPATTTLAALVGSPDRVFSALSQAGTPRDFALTAILPGRAYALGSWPPARQTGNGLALTSAALGFPLLMWLISLTVALLAIQRQVIRPIRGLGRRMRRFADGRVVAESRAMANAPSELSEIDETFASMAEQIMHDEAELEDAVHERGVLLREVHHRVKNNLQLMSSILNMQCRIATTPQARIALRSVQDRLTALATVHRSLYEVPELSRVRVDALLDELLHQLASVASERLKSVTLDIDLDQVILEPEKANPLAMLATEAFTNALKYVGPDAEGQHFIAVALRCVAVDAADEITFEIENTVAPDLSAPGTQGLGTGLIAAFAQQLGATVTKDSTPGRYRLTVSFVPGVDAVDCTET